MPQTVRVWCPLAEDLTNAYVIGEKHYCAACLSSEHPVRPESE